MTHNNKIEELMRSLSAQFFSSKKRQEEKIKYIHRNMVSLATFKEEQFRILIENKLQDFERKEYHGDPKVNEITIMGARIFADDLLSEFKNDDLI